MEKIINKRKTFYDVNPIFPARWSPRAMTGDAISDEELMCFFEAARWSPSSYNNQPWRFLYVKKDDKEWNTYFDLLVEQNQMWAKNASVLIVIISKKTFDYNNKSSITHSFDAGAAWMSLALQASMKGWYSHGMQGFDYEKTKKTLNIPDDFQVEAMAAIGKLGDKNMLPEKMQEMEEQSDRKPINDIVARAKFNW